MLTMEDESGYKYPLYPPVSVPSGDFQNIELNLSNIFVNSNGASAEVELTDPEYEQFLADVWVGIVLTLMVLSCVCFMCSCLIYHKFQQWKSRVIQARNAANLETGAAESELPSYTIATGLPTYEEALEQLKQVKELSGYSAKPAETIENWTPRTPPTPVNTLSVVNLFQLYRNNESVPAVPVTTPAIKTN